MQYPLTKRNSTYPTVFVVVVVAVVSYEFDHIELKSCLLSNVSQWSHQQIYLFDKLHFVYIAHAHRSFHDNFSINSYSCSKCAKKFTLESNVKPMYAHLLFPMSANQNIFTNLQKKEQVKLLVDFVVVSVHKLSANTT